MKVLLAGGSGAIGNRLIPLLVSYGHHVIATLGIKLRQTTGGRKESGVTEL